VDSKRRNRSGRFWFAGDLALDLLAEFQGPGNLRKNFRRSAGASYDDGSVAQDSSQRRLFDGDAFNSLEKKLDGAAIRKARLHDDSFVGDGHLRGVATDEANSKKDRRCDQTCNACPSQWTDSRRFASFYGTPWRNEQAYANECKDRCDQRMPDHHNPMQAGFILHGLAGDEMLFRVAQRGSSKSNANILASGKTKPVVLLEATGHQMSSGTKQKT
jgi:hypothetical protein